MNKDIEDAIKRLETGEDDGLDYEALVSFDKRNSKSDSGIIVGIGTINLFVKLPNGKRVSFSGSASDIELDMVDVD